ncbi:MAG: DUF1049 domain-containing protein [Alphaproteobacteria bacterium]|jgi:uncharacterized integral membrane protein|nr:DUF1049 domain-containing protein [Alphaproteobacteria bacterium]
MMAYLRIALSAVLAILLATIALANRDFVAVQLFPDTIGALIGFNFGFALPLFILLGLAIGLGLMLGFIWEWLREHSYRAEAARLRRKVDDLEADMAKMEKAAPAVAQKDDVLAVLEAK